MGHVLPTASKMLSLSLSRVYEVGEIHHQPFLTLSYTTEWIIFKLSKYSLLPPARISFDCFSWFTSLVSNGKIAGYYHRHFYRVG